MKKMSVGKRLLALLLALTMVLSMAACGAPEKKPEQKESPVPMKDEDELSREDQELIVELMGDGTDPEKLTDEELKKLVDQMIGDKAADQIVNLSNKEQEKTPTLDMESNSDAYDENGAMTKPFDQVYPEVIQKEEVKFSGEFGTPSQ